MTKTQFIDKQNILDAKYLVTFISKMSANSEGYQQAANQMMIAVQSQPGFIGVYSARDDNGVGITNSYWSSLDAIAGWKANTAHQTIQEKGKTAWYEWYQLQVCEIIKNY